MRKKEDQSAVDYANTINFNPSYMISKAEYVNAMYFNNDNTYRKEGHRRICWWVPGIVAVKSWLYGKTQKEIEDILKEPKTPNPKQITIFDITR